MNEFENIHADTALDDREVRELVARLTNPSTRQDQRTKVRDIAETMDIDVETVLSTLQDIRLKWQTEIPVEAAKLAAELEVMKTPIRKSITFAPTRRMIFLTSFLVFVLMVGGFMAVRQLTGPSRIEAALPPPSFDASVPPTPSRKR